MELPPPSAVHRAPQSAPTSANQRAAQSALHCGISTDIRPWNAPSDHPSSSNHPSSHPPAAAPARDGNQDSREENADYRHALKPTPAGWPIRQHWCVWVEPVVDSGPTGIWEQRWHQAVIQALTTWQHVLPITRVDQPERAQVLVQRRRPPILNRRASHGRAVLQLLDVKRQGEWQLEPRVTVLISPGQAQPAIQATALHELGHAFGLWGHSDQAGDVMAVKPGALPVLELSERDRRTLEWLQQQPGLQTPSP